MPLRDYGCIILSCLQRLARRTSTRVNASCGLAILAVGVHPVPYRTRKLSPHAPMVLQGQPCGRVGRRHPTSRIGSFFVCQLGLGHSPAAATASPAYEYARLSVRLRNRDQSASNHLARHRNTTVLSFISSALHLTYISMKQVFCQLVVCQITYISVLGMYVIWFRLRIVQGQNLVSRPGREKRWLSMVSLIEHVSTRTATTPIFHTAYLLIEQ